MVERESKPDRSTSAAVVVLPQLRCAQVVQHDRQVTMWLADLRVVRRRAAGRLPPPWNTRRSSSARRRGCARQLPTRSSTRPATVSFVGTSLQEVFRRFPGPSPGGRVPHRTGRGDPRASPPYIAILQPARDGPPPNVMFGSFVRRCRALAWPGRQVRGILPSGSSPRSSFPDPGSAASIGRAGPSSRSSPGRGPLGRGIVERGGACSGTAVENASQKVSHEARAVPHGRRIRPGSWGQERIRADISASSALLVQASRTPRRSPRAGRRPRDDVDLLDRGP